MGRELETSVRFGDITREHAKVHLDSRALQVSGRPRIEVLFSEIERVQVDGGQLLLTTPRGVLAIRAGESAAAWAEKIQAPPSRAKKLGLRTGQRVALSGLEDAALAREIEASGAQLVSLAAGLDVLFFGVEAPAQLERLPALVKKLAPDGALWVVRTKGRAASVSEAAVRSAARGAGLTDVKVVAFSETQSADKFVLPLAQRGAMARPVAKKAVKQRALEQKAGAAAAPARRASAPRARAPAGRARTG
jgi:hypothetical protein